MAGRIALDTTFLIDLQRERARGKTDGPAHRYLDGHPEIHLHLPVVALGEFAEGFEDRDDPILRLVREQHVLLPVDEDVALLYGRITRGLRRTGRLIGSTDLWIAATCLHHELPLLTGNPGEFGRVDGLAVVAYR